MSKHALYIGSSVDMVPALLYPEFEWTFVTSEGTGYWGASCPLETQQLETLQGFKDSISQQLPAGAVVTSVGNVVTCLFADTCVTIYYATKFPSVSEECRERIANAVILWHIGFTIPPDMEASIREMCPHLVTTYVNGGTFQNRLRGLSCEEIPEYGYGPPITIASGYDPAEYIDFSQRLERD